MIRGTRGTSVNLIILRNKNYLEKNIIRDKITLKAVEHKMLDKKIAYIKIATFMSHAAAEEFINALQATKEAESMIIDLRGNQGGLLQNATFIANILLQKLVAVSVVKNAKTS